jgi:zinc finger CCHC domain-containing protein 8
MQEKRGLANGSRTASRYYQLSMGAKYDDLKPGIIGSETRQLLGIGVCPNS